MQRNTAQLFKDRTDTVVNHPVLSFAFPKSHNVVPSVLTLECRHLTVASSEVMTLKSQTEGTTVWGFGKSRRKQDVCHGMTVLDLFL